MILERRFMVDGSNVDTDVNVEVVEELDVELTKQLIIRGMADDSK